MLKTRIALHFPKIEFHSKRKNKNDQDVILYNLDWEMFDKKIEWDFTKCVNKLGFYYSPLPHKYDQLLSNTVFSLDEKYMLEIRDQAQHANMEFGKKRSFDTVIREMCLNPAIASVEVAFRLLADTIYDIETNYFIKDYDQRSIILYSMLYRFWFYQTGAGLIMENAGFKNLHLKNEKISTFRDELKNHLDTFIKRCDDLRDKEINKKVVE